MNKKIKVIDLLNKIANREEVPKTVKYNEKEYNYHDYSKNYYYIDDKEECLFDDDIAFRANNEVELLEDNTEKQEYLGESWKEVGKRVGEWAKEFEQGFKESFTEIVTCPFKKLEDNTEDIEELEIDENGFIHTSKGAWKGRKMDIVFAESLNQLARTIKQLKSEQN